MERNWFKSRIGFDSSDAQRIHSFCTYTGLPQYPDVFVVLDATKNELLKNNIFVTGPPYLRFYAGTRVIVGGVIIGTFCIFDPNPRSFFSLSDQMLLLSFGTMVSNAIVMRRSRELRHREKINRQLRMKFYSNMNFLSLKHNLRTPVSNLSISILNLIDDQSNNQKNTHSSNNDFILILLKKLQNYTFLLQKIIEICLFVIETLIQKNDFLQQQDYEENQQKEEEDGLKEETFPSPYGVKCNLDSIIFRFEKIIEILQSVNTINNLSKIQFNCNYKRSNHDSNQQNHNDVLVERTYPQLFFTFVTITMCLMAILIYHPEILLILFSIETEISSMIDSDSKVKNSSHSSNRISDLNHLGLKESIERKTGKILLRVSINYKFELDINVFNGIKSLYKNSKLVQMIHSVGGDISIIDGEKNLQFLFWLPYESEMIYKQQYETLSPLHLNQNTLETFMTVDNSLNLKTQQQQQHTFLKILIIDDSILVHNIIREYYQQTNCEVNTCLNGELGLSELKKSTTLQVEEESETDQQIDSAVCQLNKSKYFLHSNYDIVFVDLLMPTKSGVEMMINYIDWIDETFQNNHTSIDKFQKYKKNFSNAIFIGLLPPYSSFSEMVEIPKELKNNDSNDRNIHGENDDESYLNEYDPHPDDYGFDGIISTPFNMIDIIELISLLCAEKLNKKK